MVRKVNEVNVFDPTFNRLEVAMKNRAMMQSIIAHNIANANTPGFKPIKFDDVLGKAVRSANTVDLEEEMSDMAKNSTEYSSYVRLINGKLSTLRSVVTQGRK
ncbi:MAG: flagellar basal body protein [bacterium]